MLQKDDLISYPDARYNTPAIIVQSSLSFITFIFHFRSPIHFSFVRSDSLLDRTKHLVRYVNDEMHGKRYVRTVLNEDIHCIHMCVSIILAYLKRGICFGIVL